MKFFVLIFSIFISSLSLAQVQITVDASQKDKPISRNIFGLFTEHIDKNVYLGAWAQVLENPEFVSASAWPVRTYGNRMTRKLEQAQENFNLPSLVTDSENGFAAFWASSGNIKGRLLKDGNRDFQQLKVGEQGGYIETGVYLPLHRTSGYDVQITLRAEESTEVTLQVLNQNKTLVGQSVFKVNTKWETLKTKIQMDANGYKKGDPYLIRLLVKPGKVTEFSRLLCFPDDNIDGWEPELIAYLKKLKLPLLRFPGGNFVSGYHWMDGIGPIDSRPVLSNPAWHEMEWNYVGTDEWMILCRLIGAEPMICINAGNGTPEEAANWVRYCNESPDMPFGKMRAENGHPEPYHVKIWEVGNELCGPWQIGFADGKSYARRYASFANDMLKADPGISLIANGLIRVLEKSVAIDRGENTDWNEKLMEHNGNLVQSISVHSLVGGAVDASADPVETWEDMVAFIENYPDFLQQLVVEPMKAAGVEPHIAITELMDWARPATVGNVTSISGALWYSGIMNVCIRSKGLINLVTRTALMNHGGGMRKEHGIIYTEPVYWSHLMYASQNGTIPLEVTTNSPTFSSSGKYVIKKENMPLIDASALTTEKGDETSLFITNRDAKSAQEIELSVKGINLNSEAEMVMIQCNDLSLRNNWDGPEKIAPVFSKIKVKGENLKYTMPPLSVARIILKSK